MLLSSIYLVERSITWASVHWLALQQATTWRWDIGEERTCHFSSKLIIPFGSKLYDKFISYTNQQDQAGLQAEKFAAREVQLLETGLEDDLRSFGRGFTVLEQVWNLPWAVNFIQLSSYSRLLHADNLNWAVASGIFLGNKMGYHYHCRANTCWCLFKCFLAHNISKWVGFIFLLWQLQDKFREIFWSSTAGVCTVQYELFIHVPRDVCVSHAWHKL